MAAGPLRATAFRGDEDVAELHHFFLPEQQFDGDVLWSFGTSLKSAYVNNFEFMNHAPVVQLWRDDHEEVQAVSRISLGQGEWFHQAAPRFRSNAVTVSIIEQADAALALLSDYGSWRTVRYESDLQGLELLAQHGYQPEGRDEVFMSMALGVALSAAPQPDGVEIRLLDETDSEELRERGLAQVDAFSQGPPTAEGVAWVHRTIPHQLAYGAQGQSSNVVAIEADGTCLALADVFFDPVHRIGEFEPVATRPSARRRGLASAVLHRGLDEMRRAGMTQAIVRTGVDNAAAIAAYESVGFLITDHRISLRKKR